MNISNIETFLVEQLGKNEGTTLSKNIENILLEEIPVVDDFPHTTGNWNVSYGLQNLDYKPVDSLSYQKIKDMLNSGIIQFGLEMKRAQMYSIFKNDRVITVVSKDKELKELVEAVVSELIPHAAYEFTHSALVYGTAFMEKVYGYKTAHQLGISKNKTSKLYLVPTKIVLVPHQTITTIKRSKKGSFEGYYQNPLYWGDGVIRDLDHGHLNEIFVPESNALVIPYNGFSRNLWGESFLKPVHNLWFWYNIVMKSMVRFSEMMGDPPILGRAPSNRAVKVATTNKEVMSIPWLLATIANLKYTNAIVLPSDVDENGKQMWDAQYLSLPDRSQPFQHILGELSKAILRGLINADTAVTTSQDRTSVNSSEIHSGATAYHNEMVATSWLSYINRHLIKKIGTINKGDDSLPVKLAIKGLDPQEREFFKTLVSVSGNFSSFEEFALSIDWKHFAESVGLPIQSDQEIEKLRQRVKDEFDRRQEIDTQNKLVDETKIVVKEDELAANKE